jgi:hypothetical protein
VSLAIAVLSLTRDRLDYTKHCFASLRSSQAATSITTSSTRHLRTGRRTGSGTMTRPGWCSHRENIGVCRGLNTLLDLAFEIDDYDVVVKFDNDCELTQPEHAQAMWPSSSRRVAASSRRGSWVLRQPPQAMRQLDDRWRGDPRHPPDRRDLPRVSGWVFNEFRYNEANPLYGLDDVDLCRWFRQQGGTCGYVKRLEAWHYESTDGQHARYPDYFERKHAEMAAA